MASSTEPLHPSSEQYYMLESFAPADGIFTDILAYPRVPGAESWLTGARFPSAIAEPIRLEWDPSTTGPRKALYDVTIPVAHVDLLAALKAAAVDNLDCYRVEIVDARTGVVSSEYRAVNVVGVIAAADMAGSKISPGSSSRGLIDVDFDSLAIDASRARNSKLFRLAECCHGIAVHRSVKELLQSRGGFGLTFVPPADWIG